MSLPLLILFTLSNIALANPGDEGCSEDSFLITSESAIYVEGKGCVITDVREACEEYENNDCRAWDQVVAIYEDSTPEVRAREMLDCAKGSDYAHRWDRGETEWDAYDYFDEDGFFVGAFSHSFMGPSLCCDGVETSTLYYGDPYATCIEPTDTGDADTGDTPQPGPCGCATDTGAAAALLAASSLLTVRRRRQP